MQTWQLPAGVAVRGLALAPGLGPDLGPHTDHGLGLGLAGLAVVRATQACWVAAADGASTDGSGLQRTPARNATEGGLAHVPTWMQYSRQSKKSVANDDDDNHGAMRRVDGEEGLGLGLQRRGIEVVLKFILLGKGRDPTVSLVVWCRPWEISPVGLKTHVTPSLLPHGLDALSPA